MINNPKRKHHHNAKRRRHWRPDARKTIRTTNLVVMLCKLAVFALITYSVVVTIRMKYLANRCDIMETSIDSFYTEDNVSSIKNNDKLFDKMTQISSVYQLALEKYIDIKDENDKLNKDLVQIGVDMALLDLENMELIEARDSYKEDLSTFTERAELYDKYEETIYFNNERTDITYDQLKTGVDIMQQNNIDPALLFAIIMTESHGIEDAKNPTSTATGYGQILESTGKSVYEKYMGNGKGSFDTSMLVDGDKNVEITAYYIDYCIKNNSDIYKALLAYRGTEDESWERKVDSYLNAFGTSIATINKEVYSGSST